MLRQVIVIFSMLHLLALPIGKIVAQPSPRDLEYFERKVRPILVENCFKCHGPQKQRGGLRLDSRLAILAGGDQGPAIEPGRPEKSLLVKAIRQGDELKMPPEKKLSAQQIADLTLWVKLGAPWPGDDGPTARQGEFKISEKDRAHWSFQPIRRPPVPSLKQHPTPRSPIDAFVLRPLEAKGLQANGQACRRDLIRRAYFDLVGLPPPPEAVAAFLNDPDPQAFEKLIDRLLASPHYGERWGRHWLDVVRFAQTNGYERDAEKPFAWRYRDFVIRAFNQDKPYDRFVLEQLAGDELPDATADSRIATGFYRIGVWDDEPDDARMAEYDGLDDIMVSTGASFLGLTLGCARCHDHKFDPVPQSDYYSILSFFRNIRPYEGPAYTLEAATYLPLEDPPQIARAVAERDARVRKLQDKLKQTKDPGEKKKLETQVQEARNLEGLQWALGVREPGPQPPATRILIRGNAGTPGGEVQPAFLSVLGGRPKLATVSSNSQTSGRRLALARWIASKDNPLTARVLVNRIWQHHFGQGIVKSTSDFGRTGLPPTHPELLDWLTAEFLDAGWSMKQLHKRIMLSETYQRSSEAQNPQAAALDPGNDLLWRQNLRRLEAEAIRDTVLSVSGQLSPAMGGRGFFPHLGGEVLAGASKPGLGWESSSELEQSRRSVYTFIKRTLVTPALDAFDYSNTAQPLGERAVTTVAPQALLLLNDDFMQKQAAALARRLSAEADSDAERQVRRAFELAFSRRPTSREVALALDYMHRQEQAFARLQTRLTFRPEVPFSVEASYLQNQLRPTDFLSGPREGWTYHRGRWTGGYEGIKTVDVQRGPFALWQGVPFADGTLQAQMMLHNAAELGAVIFCSKATGDVFRGYEVVLSPREGMVALCRHAADVKVIGKTSRELPTGQPLPLRIETAGNRIRIWLGSEKPILDVVDPDPLREGGHVGVRSWGAGITLDDLSLTITGKRFELTTAERSNPRQSALESFCLLVLNLNELIYVD